MFVEALIEPLKGADDQLLSSEVVTQRVLDLLADIQHRPLKSAEMRLIRSATVLFLQRNKMDNDKKLCSLVNARFAMEYIPFVSTLGLTQRDGDGSSAEALGQHQMSDPSQLSTNGSKEAQLSLLEAMSTRRQYFLCSIRRHQTALWTNYRMYCDGIREFNSKGELGKPIMNGKPIMLFGAKKFKSGNSTNLVWDHTDAKQWKEKYAVGKITKYSNNKYFGVPISSPMSGSTVNSATDPWNDTNSGSNSPVVTRNDDSKLTTNNTSDSSVADTDPNLDNAVSTPEAEFNAIAIAVSSSGMDKLIHLTAAVNLPVSSGQTSNDTPSTSISNITDGNSTSVEIKHTNAKLERSIGSLPCKDIALSSVSKSVYTVTQLESILTEKLHTSQPRVTNSVCDILIKVLRSKQPRKVPTTGRGIGSTHTVAYGKNSRVKAASRKNIVMDEVINSDADAANELASSAEWVVTAETTTPPILQIGKLDEQLFSLDFHEVTPFQAFVVAMAAFDQ